MPETQIILPATEKVPNGLQTLFGYGTAIAGPLSAIVLAILQSQDAINAMPPWLYAILVALSPILVAITGKNRSDQKVANTHAAATVAAAALYPVDPATLTLVPPLPPADETDSLAEAA